MKNLDDLTMGLSELDVTILFRKNMFNYIKFPM